MKRWWLRCVEAILYRIVGVLCQCPLSVCTGCFTAGMWGIRNCQSVQNNDDHAYANMGVLAAEMLSTIKSNAQNSWPYQAQGVLHSISRVKAHHKPSLMPIC